MMTDSRWICSLATIACVCCGLTWSVPASAQTRSLFGNNGTGAGAGRGSGAGGTGGSQAAGRGGSSLFGGGSAGRGGGTAGRGGGAGGRAGGLANPLQSMNTMGGAPTGARGGNTGFVGRDDSAGRFVGRQDVGQGGAGRNQFGGSTNNFANQFGNLGNRNLGRNGLNGLNNFNQPRGGGQSTSLGTFRPQQRIAFEHPPRIPAQIDLRLETQLLDVASRRPTLRNVNVAVADGGRVVLRGQVPTPEARKLAENLVRLEPGVRGIENELTVATPPPSGAPQPPVGNP